MTMKPPKYRHYVTVRTDGRDVILRSDWRVGENDSTHVEIPLSKDQVEIIANALARAIDSRDLYGTYPTHAIFLELEIPRDF